MAKQDLFRALPQVDEVLSVFDSQNLSLKNSVREAIDSIRKEIKDGLRTTGDKDSLKQEIINNVKSQMSDLEAKKSRTGLRRVINATGIVIHTNLGRSLLCKSAIEKIGELCSVYNNLEYDIEQGKRGSRHTHVEEIIRDITGAESAMVVNNNAGATLIALTALAQGKEVITSRGELVEIGGSFRVPEIMEQGGAILKEVGTTNRTRIEDYRKAFSPEKTAAMMKVHKSNYRILGFTEETSIKEIADLAKELDTVSIYDLGSGNMVDLSRWGINEPAIPELVKMGIDVLLFSGDKMLGGPQCGIIIGRKKYIDIMKKHPLARALRVDKITLAALTATLDEYRDPKKAFENIPTLAMISVKNEVLKERALNFASLIGGQAVPCKDLVGGGSDPTHELDGWGVKLMCNANEKESMLRAFNPAIVCRIEDDCLLFSMRTITSEEEKIIQAALS